MNKEKMKKIRIAIFIVAVAALIFVWAINGYEDTWLYVACIMIVTPSAWFFKKMNNHKKL